MVLIDNVMNKLNKKKIPEVVLGPFSFSSHLCSRFRTLARGSSRLLLTLNGVALVVAEKYMNRSCFIIIYLFKFRILIFLIMKTFHLSNQLIWYCSQNT